MINYRKRDSPITLLNHPNHLKIGRIRGDGGILQKILGIVIFCLMWMTYGWSVNIHDYENYEEFFNESETFITLGVVNIGYNHLNHIFYKLGWTFFEFRILYSLICLVLLFILVKKYSLKPNPVLIIYGVCVFFVDLIQMRNYLAYLICFLSLSYLISPEKYSKTKYTIWIIIASTIHIACIFYLTFIFIPLKKKLNWRYFLIFGLTTTVVIPRIIQYTVNTYGLLIHETLFYYSIFALIPCVAILLGNIFVITIFDSKHSNHICKNLPKSHSVKLGVTQASYLFIYNCNVMFLTLLPLCYMSAVSLRLNRNFFIINLILISNQIIINKYKIKKQNLLILIIYIAFSFIYFEWIKDIFSPIINNNILWN